MQICENFTSGNSEKFCEMVTRKFHLRILYGCKHEHSSDIFPKSAIFKLNHPWKVMQGKLYLWLYLNLDTYCG
jgi:hypothetical protein